ncbi:hypothetical protein SprV_0100168000 [Sparganum proliferum]
MNGLSCKGVIFADDIKVWRAINDENDELTLQEGLSRLSTPTHATTTATGEAPTPPILTTATILSTMIAISPPHTTGKNILDIQSATTLAAAAPTTTNNAYSISNGPHSALAITPRIGPVGCLRIYSTETGKLVSEAPTYTNRTYINCTHYPRISTHLIDLPGYMPIQENQHNGLAQRLVNLSVSAAPAAAAAADENASVENQWCQLGDIIQSTVLAVLGRAGLQQQDWFDDNDAAISNLLTDKNRLHKASVNRPTDGNKAASYHSRRLVQQRLCEMQDSWTAREADEI